jgi:hypothetical protein
MVATALGSVAILHLRLFGVCSPPVIQGEPRGRTTTAVCFKGAHFPTDIILTCVRWSVAYPLSTRHIEEFMQEREVSVDHSTVNRWVVKYSPQLADGRDIHQGERAVVLLVPCRG